MLEKEFDALSEKYQQAAHEIEVNEAQVGQSQQKFIETLGSLSDAKSSVSKFGTEKELLSSNLENVEKEIKETKTKLDEQQSTKTDLLASLSQKEGAYAISEKEYGESLAKSTLLASRLQDFENDRQNKATELKVYENRLKLLTEMQAEFEGYNFAVKKLLKLASASNSLSKNIVGVVASLIKVPEKYETAIEVALGSSVQNIVTFDEKGAKELVEYLKENHFGRATFLPIPSMKRRSVNVSSIKNMKGFVGVADELISFDKKIENVVSGLLGGTIIVERLIDAIEMSKASGYAFKIVSLDGDVINPQGSITGGSKKSEAVGIMSREREIETLKKEIEKLTAFLKNAENEKSALVSEYNTAKERTQKAIDRKNELSVEITSIKAKLEALENVLKEAKEDLNVLEMERQTIENKLKLVSEQYEKSALLQSALSGNESDANALVENKKAHTEKLRKEREDLSAKLTSVKVDIASVKTQIENLKAELIRLANEIGTQNENIRLLNAHIEDNLSFIESAEELIKTRLASAPRSQAKEELDDLTQKQKKTEEEKIQLSALIRSLDTQKTGLMEELNRINDRKYREEMNLAKVDSDIEVMQERIYEEYSLAYNDCLDLKRPDFDIKVAMPEIAKIKRAISALGPINVNAIEDCSALLERYNTLSEQSNDLKKAEEDLTKIIKDLSEIMIEKFTSELEKINESFKITFRELFGGGNAKLELVDPENPLESGVEVFVQPPGKKIQNMSLYSGGEKSLTAMAIIFAILRIKPLPFCLFDEVEAALDDSNVEIVDKYLKKLSDETQFILITHKKPTMEYADSLFGVTMEEKGVSKIVSVKLSDAIKLDESA